MEPPFPKVDYIILRAHYPTGGAKQLWKVLSARRTALRSSILTTRKTRSGYVSVAIFNSVHKSSRTSFIIFLPGRSMASRLLQRISPIMAALGKHIGYVYLQLISRWCYYLSRVSHNLIGLSNLSRTKPRRGQAATALGVGQIHSKPALFPQFCLCKQILKALSCLFGKFYFSFIRCGAPALTPVMCPVRIVHRQFVYWVHWPTLTSLLKHSTVHWVTEWIRKTNAFFGEYVLNSVFSPVVFTRLATLILTHTALCLFKLLSQ